MPFEIPISPEARLSWKVNQLLLDSQKRELTPQEKGLISTFYPQYGKQAQEQSIQQKVMDLLRPKEISPEQAGNVSRTMQDTAFGMLGLSPDVASRMQNPPSLPEISTRVEPSQNDILQAIGLADPAGLKSVYTDELNRPWNAARTEHEVAGTTAENALTDYRKTQNVGAQFQNTQDVANAPFVTGELKKKAIGEIGGNIFDYSQIDPATGQPKVMAQEELKISGELLEAYKAAHGGTLKGVTEQSLMDFAKKWTAATEKTSQEKTTPELTDFVSVYGRKPQSEKELDDFIKRRTAAQTKPSETNAPDSLGAQRLGFDKEKFVAEEADRKTALKQKEFDNDHKKMSQLEKTLEKKPDIVTAQQFATQINKFRQKYGEPTVVIKKGLFGYDVREVPAAQTSAPISQPAAGQYKVGDTRTINGVKYIRDAQGQWQPQS